MIYLVVNYKNRLKYFLLYQIATFIAKSLLIIGWLIFLVWYLSRIFPVINFELLEAFGIIWVLIGIILGSASLILFLFFVLINYKKFRFQWFASLFILLLNIPSVIFILYFHKEETKYSRIVFCNKSRDLIRNCEVIFNDRVYVVGNLSSNRTKRLKVRPKMRGASGREYNDINEFGLIIKSRNYSDTVWLNNILQAECVHIQIMDSIILQKNYSLK